MAATRSGLLHLSPARAEARRQSKFWFYARTGKFQRLTNPENLITFDGAPATRTRSNGTSLGRRTWIPHRKFRSSLRITPGIRPHVRRTNSLHHKTGTNQFHGAAYEYLRNTALNANTWARNANSNGLTKDAAPVHYNQFGFNIAAPSSFPANSTRARARCFSTMERNG